MIKWSNDLHQIAQELEIITLEYSSILDEILYDESTDAWLPEESMSGLTDLEKALDKICTLADDCRAHETTYGSGY